jgi:hypothetical protein
MTTLGEIHARIEAEEGKCVHFDEPFPYRECEAEVEQRVEVPYSATVVFDGDGALVAVNMTCGVCGERGYKGMPAIADHARTHLPVLGEFRCDNCGKSMAEHDEMAHCWPKRAGWEQGETGGPAVPDSGLSPASRSSRAGNDGFDKVTLADLRRLPDGSLTKAEVNLLIGYIERLERKLTDGD